jgi:hypothetical protein
MARERLNPFSDKKLLFCPKNRTIRKKRTPQHKNPNKPVSFNVQNGHRRDEMERTQLLTGLFILAISGVLLLSGCTSVALTCEDQSRQQLDRCNTDCGEGLGSELCKTGCTSAHNDRLEQCAQQR